MQMDMGFSGKESQMNKIVMKTCPRCKEIYDGYPAISRRDNKTEICSNCGGEEALFDMKIHALSKNVDLIDEVEKEYKAERAWLEEKEVIENENI